MASRSQSLLGTAIICHAVALLALAQSTASMAQGLPDLLGYTEGGCYGSRLCVVNQGRGDAGPFGVEPPGIRFDALEPGESRCVPLVALPLERPVIDAAHEVRETNEDNNIAGYAIVDCGPLYLPVTLSRLRRGLR